MEDGEHSVSERDEKPLVQPQHVGLAANHRIDRESGISNNNFYAGDSKHLKSSMSSAQTMRVSHPSLLNLNTASAVTSEPLLKRIKLESSDAIDTKNVAHSSDAGLLNAAKSNSSIVNRAEDCNNLTVKDISQSNPSNNHQIASATSQPESAPQNTPTQQTQSCTNGKRPRESLIVQSTVASPQEASVAQPQIGAQAPSLSQPLSSTTPLNASPASPITATPSVAPETPSTATISVGTRHVAIAAPPNPQTSNTASLSALAPKAPSNSVVETSIGPIAHAPASVSQPPPMTTIKTKTTTTATSGGAPSVNSTIPKPEVALTAETTLPPASNTAPSKFGGGNPSSPKVTSSSVSTPVSQTTSSATFAVKSTHIPVPTAQRAPVAAAPAAPIVAAPAPQVIAAPTTSVAVAPAPQVAAAPAPLVAAAPAPQVAAASAPQVAAAPAPQVAAAPAPQVAAAPAPQIAAAPALQAVAAPNSQAAASTPARKVAAAPTSSVAVATTSQIAAAPTPQLTSAPASQVAATPARPRAPVAAAQNPHVAATPAPQVPPAATPATPATPQVPSAPAAPVAAAPAPQVSAAPAATLATAPGPQVPVSPVAVAPAPRVTAALQARSSPPATTLQITATQVATAPAAPAPQLAAAPAQRVLSPAPVATAPAPQVAVAPVAAAPTLQVAASPSQQVAAAQAAPMAVVPTLKVAAAPTPQVATAPAPLVAASPAPQVAPAPVAAAPTNQVAVAPSAPVAVAPNATTAASSDGSVPLKSTTFQHLNQKYLEELEYMLREFQKLERQLLGAKTQSNIESVGSRERREKLHSFILHLEETIQQILTGCRLQAEGKATVTDTSGIDSSLSNQLTREKAEEENVQKLEEHILANLLPVKVRLKKQLAAQQGAKQNPAGMPTMRGAQLGSAEEPGKATFLKNAPAERRGSQFGKPLDGGSSLTQKLHGQTLGSSARAHGHGVGQAPTGDVSAQAIQTNESKPESQQSQVGKEKTKTLYAGMALGSTQIKSSLSAAHNVHKLEIEDPALLERAAKRDPIPPGNDDDDHVHEDVSSGWSSPSSAARSVSPSRHVESQPKPVPVPLHPGSATIAPAHAVKQEPQQHEKFVATQSQPESVAQQQPVPQQPTVPQQQLVAQQPSVPQQQPTLHHHPVPQQQPVSEQQQAVVSASVQQDVHKETTPQTISISGLTPFAKRTIMSYEEQRKLRRKKRRKKRKLREQNAENAALGQKSDSPKKSKKSQRQRGPRNVEYTCALCNEIYNSTCDYNPWWALTQHDCPKCHKSQIPKIDIGAPANAIEYHPALLAHADENGGGAPTAVMFDPPQAVPSSCNSESESDLSDDDGLLSDDDDDTVDSSGSEPEDISSMSPADQAENERFGAEYKGPKLSDDHSARLLILMLHASTCRGQHRSENHADICKSTKWMMLHVRDCPGTTATFDVCPFPWCRKVKHLLYHLVSCQTPDKCGICSPTNLNPNMRQLRALNDFRFGKQRKSIVSQAKAASNELKMPPATDQSTQDIPTSHPPASVSVSSVQQNPAAANVKLASNVGQSEMHLRDSNASAVAQLTAMPAPETGNTACNVSSASSAAPVAAQPNQHNTEGIAAAGDQQLVSIVGDAHQTTSSATPVAAKPTQCTTQGIAPAGNQPQVSSVGAANQMSSQQPGLTTVVIKQEQITNEAQKQAHSTITPHVPADSVSENNISVATSFEPVRTTVVCQTFSSAGERNPDPATQSEPHSIVKQTTLAVQAALPVPSPAPAPAVSLTVPPNMGATSAYAAVPEATHSAADPSNLAASCKQSAVQSATNDATIPLNGARFTTDSSNQAAPPRQSNSVSNTTPSSVSTITSTMLTASAARVQKAQEGNTELSPSATGRDPSCFSPLETHGMHVSSSATASTCKMMSTDEPLIAKLVTSSTAVSVHAPVGCSKTTVSLPESNPTSSSAPCAAPAFLNPSSARPNTTCEQTSMSVESQAKVTTHHAQQETLTSSATKTASTVCTPDWQASSAPPGSAASQPPKKDIKESVGPEKQKHSSSRSDSVAIISQTVAAPPSATIAAASATAIHEEMHQSTNQAPEAIAKSTTLNQSNSTSVVTNNDATTANNAFASEKSSSAETVTKDRQVQLTEQPAGHAVNGVPVSEEPCVAIDSKDLKDKSVVRNDKRLIPQAQTHANQEASTSRTQYKSEQFEAATQANGNSAIAQKEETASNPNAVIIKQEQLEVSSSPQATNQPGSDTDKKSNNKGKDGLSLSDTHSSGVELSKKSSVEPLQVS